MDLSTSSYFYVLALNQPIARRMVRNNESLLNVKLFADFFQESVAKLHLIVTKQHTWCGIRTNSLDMRACATASAVLFCSGAKITNLEKKYLRIQLDSESLDY